MDDVSGSPAVPDPALRTDRIVETLTAAFSDLMEADPAAFRTKFRKMAAEPFAFYRGSAPLFYADLAERHDPWLDERTARIWIHGDLHAENFGTAMDSTGRLVFDVDDFDEAYLGPFTWDLRRLVASVALLGWGKAFADADIDRLVAVYVRSYLAAVRTFSGSDAESRGSLHRGNSRGAVLALLHRARESSREALLEAVTEREGPERIFRAGPGVRRLDDDERAEVVAAYTAYLETIPPAKRLPEAGYELVDVVGRSGFGIGSAGLPAYNLLIEGASEALDNDVVLSMKQGVRSAPSQVIDDARAGAAFRDHGHRTAVSQRALQARADRLLGHTRLRGVGYVVSELSPYSTELEWDDITEPDEVADTLEQLGWVTAKAHCVSDADADQELVAFQVEDAILTAVDDREDDLVEDLVAFAREYAGVVREDHRLFVEAFRHDRIPGVSGTAG